ncbi:MAG: putative acid-CoA ligase [Caulobacteraceae bacterium]|jgi:acyl-CoA synthetase (AMP-forming)/AMP-acid ligase II|nr:putative acid-CoA ligase [Caulobacteraceae bacterium]
MTFAYFDWISRHAEVRGGKRRTAVVDLGSGRRHTYRDLDDRIDRLAAHFAALGVVRGDRIAALNGIVRVKSILAPRHAATKAVSLFLLTNSRHGRSVFTRKIHYTQLLCQCPFATWLGIGLGKYACS